MQARRKNRTKAPPTQETEQGAPRDEMEWRDAVSAIASEIEALADAVTTLEDHPTVFVLIAVLLEKATKLRGLMRQRWSKQ